MAFQFGGYINNDISLLYVIYFSYSKINLNLYLYGGYDYFKERIGVKKKKPPTLEVELERSKILTKLIDTKFKEFHARGERYKKFI